MRRLTSSFPPYRDEKSFHVVSSPCIIYGSVELYELLSSQILPAGFGAAFEIGF